MDTEIELNGSFEGTVFVGKRRRRVPFDDRFVSPAPNAVKPDGDSIFIWASNLYRSPNTATTRDAIASACRALVDRFPTRNLYLSLGGEPQRVYTFGDEDVTSGLAARGFFQAKIAAVQDDPENHEIVRNCYLGLALLDADFAYGEARSDRQKKVAVARYEKARAELEESAAAILQRKTLDENLQRKTLDDVTLGFLKKWKPGSSRGSA